ncbi:MAG TPA: hypothetical protein VFN92_11240 [Solirubrobacterales bacterium]|nr:hypothetical protein [Solirubrobacterales bacterium]
MNRRKEPMRLRQTSTPTRAAIAVSGLCLAAIFLGSGGGSAALSGPATAAARGDAHVSQPYTYLKTRGTYRNTTVYGGRSWSVYQPVVLERWIAADGSGRQRELSLVPRFVSPADRAEREAAGNPPFLAHGFKTHLSDEFFPAGSFYERQYGTEMLASMPSDPAELAGWLQNRVHDPEFGGAGNGFPDSVKTIELATDLLANPAATAAQRQALVQAEALVPGVDDLGAARDEVGRSGTALGARSANSGLDTVYSLIVDPATAEILASEARMVSPPAGDSGLIQSTAYLREAEVRSRLARPGRVQRNR